MWILQVLDTENKIYLFSYFSKNVFVFNLVCQKSSILKEVNSYPPGVWSRCLRWFTLENCQKIFKIKSEDKTTKILELCWKIVIPSAKQIIMKRVCAFNERILFSNYSLFIHPQNRKPKDFLNIFHTF